MRRPCATDLQALREFLTGLSGRARYLRFFSGAPPTSAAMLRVLAGGAPGADVLVDTAGDAIIGHAMAGDRAGPDATRRTEIGVVVADGYRGVGVGSALVRRLIARAASRGATAVVMEVLAENRQVLTMITDHWPASREDRAGAYLTITAPLPAEAAPGQDAEPEHTPGSVAGGPRRDTVAARPGG